MPAHSTPSPATLCLGLACRVCATEHPPRRSRAAGGGRGGAGPPPAPPATPGGGRLGAAAAGGQKTAAVSDPSPPAPRLSVELSFELPWGFVNVNLRSYYAEGSKTLAYEVAEQLGWTTPDVVAVPIASGALFHKIGQGFSELRALGLTDDAVPALVGGQASGCQPVATAFHGGHRVQP